MFFLKKQIIMVFFLVTAQKLPFVKGINHKLTTKIFVGKTFRIIKIMNILNIWNKITNIGLPADLVLEDIIGVKIINSLVGIGILTVITYEFCYIYTSQWIKFWMLSSFLLPLFSLYILNHYNQFLMSKLIANFTLPTAVGLLKVVMSNQVDISPFYTLFLLFPVILWQKRWQRLSLICFIASSYFVFFYISKNYVSFFNLIFQDWENHILLICSSSCAILAIYLYLSDSILHAKQLEIALKELNESHEEVHQSNHDLQQANIELERFAYIASHDLKTPLRTIVSFLDLVDRKIEKKQYDDIPRLLEFAKNGSKQMHNLIGELLEYSKLNMEKVIEFEVIDLQEMVENNFNQLHSLVESKKAVVKFSNLPNIKTNRLMLSLVFQNLIENGIKYNHSKIPMIEIFHQKNTSSDLFLFKDNGVGIEKEYLEKIFEIFTRLENRQQSEGTGMGLAITKKIVEQQLKGKITIASEVGKGSVFSIELPHL
jgi:signal transduction histidine kinase